MSQTERLVYIDERIKGKGGVTLREVADRFEVVDRQVGRDIEYMRNRLGAPIEWNMASRRYEYAEKWSGLEFADEKALLFYIFARAAAGTIAYVPLAEADALDRLLQLVPLGLRKAEQAIRYELPSYDPADIEKLALLVRSMAESKRLDVAYRDAGGKSTRRGIVALRLVNYAGSWYCIAYDLGKAEMRVFRLSRFAEMAISSEKAETRVPEDEVERFLGSSFGMFKGAGDKRAVLRFYGRAASIVRDELWHTAQERSEGRDGRRGEYVELILPVSRYDELLGRVLRFGAEAEPVEPPELRKLWKTEIARMAEAIAGT